MAYALSVSLFLQSCGNSVIHDISPAEYIPREFGHKKEGELLYTRPYYPIGGDADPFPIYQEERNKETELRLAIPGQDGRKRVENTTEWPYSFHGQVHAHYLHGYEGWGSGILVGPQHLLTAGHNVYDCDDNLGWAQSVVVRLGLNDEITPYKEALTKRIYTFKSWVNQGDKAHDMALLVLDRPIGIKTGWCGLLSAPKKDLLEGEFNLTGYPRKRGTNQMWIIGPNQMWTMKYKLQEILDERLKYIIDTDTGQSGSGIWMEKWGGPYVVGVHTDGLPKDVPITPKSRNKGVRLSYTKAKQVVEWISQTSGLMEKIREIPNHLLPLDRERVGIMGTLTQQIERLNAVTRGNGKRILRELKDLNEKPSDLLHLDLEKEDPYHWRVAINGPEDSYYSGGVFFLHVRFPQEYPFMPPKIHFETKIFHPHVGDQEGQFGGHMCIHQFNILGNKWSPAFSARHVLEDIRGRLKNYTSSSRCCTMFREAYKLLKTDPEAFGRKAQEWTARYAL